MFGFSGLLCWADLVALLVTVDKFESWMEVGLFLDDLLILAVSDYSAASVATDILSSQCHGYLVRLHCYRVGVPSGSLRAGRDLTPLQRTLDVQDSANKYGDDEEYDEYDN